MRLQVLAFISIFAAGCTSLPPNELPTRGGSATFNSALAPEVAYRKIVEGTRNCYPRRHIGADFFSDNRSGRVSMSVATDLNVAALFMAEIRPGADGTIVTVSYLKGNPVFAEAVEKWTTGNYTTCPFGD